ncbi:MAG: 4Fe-4S dicluster domain-containing protein [Spirochaetaceae bacterium]|nr:4Fe-4S dicluster domain-containing protein [Myxococcales bacterium]MCB9724357.1 4Fe-4S dicluster domain-containing protein [Spirochaetaceae bacterium]
MSELDRRDFLKIVGLSAGAAATAGCEDPASKLIPYVVQPEEITPGIAVVYASTCQECSAACGLHVKTREGRPIKLEGNPDHPINRGRLCARGQAGIGRTYVPGRIEGPATRGADGALQAISWDDAKSKLAAKIAASPRKTWILGGPVGPTLDGVIDGFVAATGIAGRLTYEPIGRRALVEASEQVFGVSAVPIFDLSDADVVVDFASDFLDTGLSPTEHAGQIAGNRDVAHHADGGARVIAISPRQNLTASNADMWVAAAPGSEGVLALALAKAVAVRKGAGVAADVGGALAGANVDAAIKAAGISRATFDKVVGKLASARRAVALPPGAASATSAGAGAAAAVLLLNVVVGAVGSRLQYPAEDAKPTAGLKDVLALIDKMKAGAVDCLIVHDLNPVYSLPAKAGFAEALSKVGLVVSFASIADETSERAGLLLPDHTPMERWGDASPRPGVRSLVQPTVTPLYDTQAIGDTLLGVGRAMGANVAAQLPEGSFKSVLEANWSGTSWRKALARGGVFGATPMRAVAVQPSAANLRPTAPRLQGAGDLTLVAFPHSFLGDGSGAPLPWMQEIPDPVTKISWNSWAEISQAKADELGVVFGDVVSIDTGAGQIEVSVYPRGGIRDDVVAVPMGQGHTVGYYASHEVDGQPGVARGANVATVLPAALDEAGGQAFLSTRATIAKTGRFRRLALSQWTDNQRKRGLAPEVSLYDLAKGGAGAHFFASPASASTEAHAAEGFAEGVAATEEPDHGEGGGGGHHFEGPPFEFESAYDAKPDQPYRWGMTIDNDKCTGCSACIAACYIENNVSIVGEEQAIRHREMTWMRIERYVGDGDDDVRDGSERRPTPDGEVLGENQVRHLPMLCQHCGAAPCEAVCPVIATYHNDEGINGMVYNRCVGTRYCANNCTYKVRRFNYFDYGRNNLPGLLGLMLNPDVTVRGQGVMEKCSFCVQRIEAARQPAKDEGRPIADGEVLTACQQSCPTGAISFGNVRDASSAVVKQAEQGGDRAYHALQILNTRSAITYLAQVRREENEGVH